MALAGCGARGEVGFDPEAAAVGRSETILVATSRAWNDGQLPLFSTERSYQPNFARFEVSVPRNRELGTIQFPDGPPPDPSAEFLVVTASRLANQQAFVAALNQRVAARAETNDGVLFVHGFNTNFAEALYRQAQLQHDLERDGPTVLFAWPSAAKLRDYVYDRESAAFSRDALEQTIAAMARSNMPRFNLVAHSMGAWLMMETMRTMARVGYDDVFAKLNAIILMSPDIDVDVFRTQALPVLARGTNIFIFVSEQDRALQVSALIQGNRARLGAVTDLSRLSDLDVQVIDLTNISDTDLLGHFALANSPALLEFTRQVRTQGLDAFQPSRPGLVGTGVQIIQQGTDIILAPLSEL